ncbi:MAG: DUF1003 domain-containing protein [bacterium]|nr:DUF1003 domain-containing protein [bacterium]
MGNIEQINNGSASPSTMSGSTVLSGSPSKDSEPNGSPQDDIASVEKSGKLTRRRQVVKSFEARFNRQRSFVERIADFLSVIFGSFTFAMCNIVFFGVWVFWNKGLIPGLVPFDPFPFGLLTTIVSLEAIFLAIFVLINQNRSANIDRLRSEVDLQVNLTTEQEVTKVLSLLKIFFERNGISLENDPELQGMLRQIDTLEIERKLEKDLNGKPRV